ncbi:hypothetical protein PRNP1_001674 [Phytophthora ramorum]
MAIIYHCRFGLSKHETVNHAKALDQKNPKRRKCTYAARRVRYSGLPLQSYSDADNMNLTGRNTGASRGTSQARIEVTVLKIRAADPEQESAVDAVLEQAKAENTKMNQTARAQHLHIAEMQSAMSRCYGTQQTHPLYTRICLPKDWDQRRAMLVSIRDEKLRNAYNFVMDPRHYVDMDKTTYSDELFESAEGDFCGIRFETVQFPGVKSLQQVYDAAVYYLTNMEISITERLGHITVRDDYETIDDSVYNARVLSMVCDNVTMETSSLLFPKLDPDGKYGMVALDSIDEDELYPYDSAKRVRKDVSATVVFTARRKPSTNGAEGELVVTMRGAAFLRIHRPQFPMPEDALHELSTGVMAWGDVMLKTVRSIVYGG